MAFVNGNRRTLATQGRESPSVRGFHVSLEPDQSQLGHLTEADASAAGVRGVRVPLSGHPQGSQVHVLGDVDALGLERGVPGRDAVHRPLPAAVVVDVHRVAGRVDASDEADHAAVAREDHAGTHEVLQLRVDPHLGLAVAVHHDGALAPRAAAADDGDVLAVGLVGLAHVLNLLRGGGTCALPMLGVWPGGRGATWVRPRSMRSSAVDKMTLNPHVRNSVYADVSF